MANPVYKVFLMKPAFEAYQVSEEQRNAIFAQMGGFMEQVGGRRILMADMSWSNEEYEYFGIEEFPSMEALMEYHDCLRSIGWFGFIQSKSFVGYSIDMQLNPVPFTAPPPAAPGETPLYKIYLLENGPAGMAMPDALFEDVQNHASQAGVVSVMNIFTRLTNEAFTGVGLERYPNAQVLLEHYEYMELHDWFKYVNAVTYVGKGVGGVLVEGPKSE